MKYLIVGLGNIGKEYELTRHNIGFLVADQLADKFDTHFTPDRYAEKAEFKYKGRTIHIIKPTTYMNLSGKAVSHWMNTEKIPIDNVLIVTDDIALPLGKIRMRTKGSAGGHNGLQNIIDVMGTDQFNRIKFGIGNDFPRGRQVEFVLGKWADNEIIDVESGISRSIEMIESFAIQGAQRTMNQFNN